MNVKGIPPITPCVSESPVPFQDPGATPWRSFCTYCPGVQVQKTILTPFSRKVDYRSYCLLITRQTMSLQETRGIHDIVERVLGLCLILKNSAGEKPIALLAFLADVIGTLDNYDVCEGKVV